MFGELFTSSLENARKTKFESGDNSGEKFTQALARAKTDWQKRTHTYARAHTHRAVWNTSAVVGAFSIIFHTLFSSLFHSSFARVLFIGCFLFPFILTHMPWIRVRVVVVVAVVFGPVRMINKFRRMLRWVCLLNCFRCCSYVVYRAIRGVRLNGVPLYGRKEVFMHFFRRNLEQWMNGYISISRTGQKKMKNHDNQDRKPLFHGSSRNRCD